MDLGASPSRHPAPGSRTPPGLAQTSQTTTAGAFSAEYDHQRPSSTGSVSSDDDSEFVEARETVHPDQAAAVVDAEEVEEERPLSAGSADTGHTSASDHADDTAENDSSPPPASSPPPFWSSTPSARPLSYHSLHRLHSGGPIQLEDHSEEDHVQAQFCWAESATIDEYVVVSGSTGIGAYVVWHCTVKTLKGGDLGLRKRYSEFDTLRANLVRSFPHAEAMIPELPRKSTISRFRPRFLEARKRGLSHFLNCVLLNPEFASSPVLKDFVFS